MSKVKFFSSFMLTVLLLSIGSGAGMAQEPPASQSREHWLIQPGDVASFGNVIVTSPVQPVEKSSIEGWEDARFTAIAVISPKPGEYTAEIINTFYKFSSSEESQSAVTVMPALRSQCMASNGASLLDANTTRLLTAHAVEWDTVCWVDEAGLYNYGVWLQAGPYVVDVYIVAFASTVADELTSWPAGSYQTQVREYNEAVARKMNQGIPFEQLIHRERTQWIGQRLLNHVVTTLITTGDVGTDLLSQPREASSSTSGPEWYGEARASHWIHTRVDGTLCGALDPTEACHHLAAWDYPYGYDQKYYGTGGYNTTCNFSGSNGCIDKWTWWLKVPESKLGVPKTFYFTAVWSGSMEAYNYAAIVWVN